MKLVRTVNCITHSEKMIRDLVEDEMKKYRCKKSFSVESYDEGGFLIPNKYMFVDVGDIYELDESGRTIIGAEIHLDASDGSWLEMSSESLQEMFEEI